MQERQAGIQGWKKTMFTPWFVVVTSLGLFAAPALATTAIERSFRDLVQRAEIIAVGTVVEVREQWDEAQQALLTAVTFSDLITVKGHPRSGTLTLPWRTDPTGYISCHSRDAALCGGRKERSV